MVGTPAEPQLEKPKGPNNVLGDFGQYQKISVRAKLMNTVGGSREGQMRQRQLKVNKRPDCDYKLI